MWFPWDVWFLLRQAYPNPTVPPIGGAHDSGIGDSPNATSPPLRLRATHSIAFSGSRLMAPFTLAVFNRTVSGEYASYEVQQTQAAFLLEKHATARHAHRRDAAKGGPGGSPESKLPQPKLRGALPTHHRVAGLPESTARKSVPPRRATSRVYLGITTRAFAMASRALPRDVRWKSQNPLHFRSHQGNGQIAPGPRQTCGSGVAKKLHHASIEFRQTRESPARGTVRHGGCLPPCCPPSCVSETSIGGSM